MSSLVCAGVGKTWQAPQGLAVEALRDVSLSVSSGEFVAILGPSGCGKSTLLELIAGLEPISRGEILIDGERVAGPNPESRDGVPGAFALSLARGGDNVAFGLKMKGVAPADEPARARAKSCAGCGSSRSRGTTRTSSRAA